MKIEEEIKQNIFRNSHQKAGINLHFTYQWLINKYKNYFKPYGITLQQYNILRILKGQYPKSISGTDVKVRMLDKSSDVSRLFQRLIQKKLVNKNISTSDKRSKDIIISEKGIALLLAIDSNAISLDHIIGSLSEKEAALLSDLLDKCREKKSPLKIRV